MKFRLLFVFFLYYSSVTGQPRAYNSSNAHSHNDYEKQDPFYAAWHEEAGSMEADIHLVNGKLLVAHDHEDIKVVNTLEHLYLDPIHRILKENNGHIYPDTTKGLQLLIDIKTAAKPTLQALVKVLQKYPLIIRNRKIRIVVSGNRPAENLYSSYPSWIKFDGRFDHKYPTSALSRIGLISGDFKQFSTWKGKGEMNRDELQRLKKLVSDAHRLKKPVRFWATPDEPEAWHLLMSLGVDYINTDLITELSQYIKNPASYSREKMLDTMLMHDDALTLMPYNRIIRSAGRVVRFGNPALENHALDVARLPGTGLVVAEDRYGILILDPQTDKIVRRWSFADHPRFRNFLSTYSGIKAFRHENSTLIAWGIAERSGDHSGVMIAEWKDSLFNFAPITILKREPAENAIPNEILVNEENGNTFLYIVLNGNDQLVKMKWPRIERIWETNTGMAPFGITMANRKIYVSNWAGTEARDSTRERAGTPWGLVYTDPRTGATASGTVSVFDPQNGNLITEVTAGLHPNAIIKSHDDRFVYVSNGSSDEITVIDTRNDQVAENIPVGLMRGNTGLYGSSPNGLTLSEDGKTLYVSNGLDNAVAVLHLGKKSATQGSGESFVKGFIPTEAYPAGLVVQGDHLIVANLESAAADVIQADRNARSIHQQLGSLSIIPLPDKKQLDLYTREVYEMNLMGRLDEYQLPPRKGISPVPVPVRMGEPSVFKHVVYIIKENKTYDQVLGDMKQGRGDSSLCVFGERLTPNTHALARQYGWMDNYYASGKSSAEGHQWTDAAMVSDYVEKNVRAWFRSYPHRQEDALVYNKSGFIWNQALDNGKTVRIFGEACKTIYDEKRTWLDLYKDYVGGKAPDWTNTSTIARVLPIISPQFPDCDNMAFSDQQRADVFLKEWKEYEQGDSMPNLMILSLPNDHSAGLSPGFPTPNAMVADNDLALGRIVEAISSGKYWDSTVIFVTQDDSQSGWDHISAYRTVGLVISPYSKRELVTTHYNQTSMVRTIEQILGIPPMNVIDATAKPMFDCFTAEKNATGFTFLPANVPLDEMNKPLQSLKGKERKYALQSLDEVFNEVDGGEDDKMNRILWYYTKGELPFPGVRK